MVVNKGPTIQSINEDCDKIRCQKNRHFLLKKIFCKLYFCSTSQKLEKKYHYGTLPLNAFTARNYLMKVF